MRRVLLTLGALVLALALGLVSVPWGLWALGRAALGDDAGTERAMEASPMWRWFDWIEARRVRL